jgi:hypothetical protein
MIALFMLGLSVQVFNLFSSSWFEIILLGLSTVLQFSFGLSFLILNTRNRNPSRSDGLYYTVVGVWVAINGLAIFASGTIILIIYIFASNYGS